MQTERLPDLPSGVIEAYSRDGWYVIPATKCKAGNLVIAGNNGSKYRLFRIICEPRKQHVNVWGEVYVANSHVEPTHHTEWVDDVAWEYAYPTGNSPRYIAIYRGKPMLTSYEMWHLRPTRSQTFNIRI